MSDKPQVTQGEVVAIFRSVLAGESEARLEFPDAWNYIYAGDVDVFVDGWRIVIFNDCAELDYVDSATAPDGRTADYDDWGFDRNPIALLTPEEAGRFERILESL